MSIHRVLLIYHAIRACIAAEETEKQLRQRGYDVRRISSADKMALKHAATQPISDIEFPHSSDAHPSQKHKLSVTPIQASGRALASQTTDSPAQFDLVLALGGDGTILSAAACARYWDIPLLGLNMGHMGFLAEESQENVADLVDRISDGHFLIDTRMTLEVNVYTPDGHIHHDWALNEAVLTHTDDTHPVDMVLAVDGQDVSTYGADGMILATPTGSTAYSFSAGGPVVWPDTEAIIMAPLAAHGLFTRPLVVGPSSRIEVSVLESARTDAVVWCDGLRAIAAPIGSTMAVSVGTRSVHLIRLDDTPFSTRLVHKFRLPVRGWRHNDNRGNSQ
ncbi:NAD kinase [Schaalia sp. lx-260]|uniref:NAD kinase n=1 Tax=Schaalia sp. lx-260 TaxID=2899082 RepID=UPI001E4E55F3|nr:NAD kinase [Schaalia sp. lx-260]MCD4550353.1 NAD kinase [Schaalia sp. lx-260]